MPGHSVVGCEACQLRWTEPPQTPDQLAGWYPSTYYGQRNVRFLEPFEYLVRRFRSQRARFIRRHSSIGKVLDVGCGRGQLLGFLREHGYEIHGVEISDNAAWHAREVLGAEVQVGNLTELEYLEASFEVVVFWHSLEHFEEPFSALDRATRLLKPGGTLVVAVPNSESIQARVAGREWFHLDLPRHRFHFGSTSLRKALEARGVSVVIIRHLGLEQNLFGALQSLYNRLGFRHNLLYSCLKSRSSRTDSLEHHKLQILLHVLTLPLVGLGALAIWLTESALRRGGTIEVLARRNRVS